MGFSEGGAADVGEGLVGGGLAEVHGEIAEDALEGIRLQQAVCADAGDDALHEWGGDALDGDAGHVGALHHALGGELVGREGEAGFGEGGGALDPERGLLRAESDLAEAADLIWIFGAIAGL